MRRGSARRAGARFRFRPCRGRAGVALAALSLALAPAAAEARQEASPAVPPPLDSLELVDGIAAIVGDTVVLRSEVEEEMVRLQAQGMEAPPRGTPQYEQLFRRLLDGIVDRMILLQHAKTRPNLSVPEEDVEGLADERFREVRSQFRSDEELAREVEAAGMNMFQYRQILRAQSRADLLLRQLQRNLSQGGELPPVSVTEEEIRAYFEQFATGQRRPATISLDRLLVDPAPSAAADSAARARAMEALAELSRGEEFEVVARRYSEDEGTRAQGGELGWVRRDDVVPAFGDAAWVAPSGRPIGPVKTRFGYHIIKVENVRGGERNLRHILVRPEITEEDVGRARARGEALADSLRGGADARALARAHDLPEREVRFGQMAFEEIEQRLGAEYARALSDPVPGTVVGPVSVSGPTGEPTFAVMHVREYRPEGSYELEDVRENIRERLLQEKQFQRYLERLRERTYVQILAG